MECAEMFSECSSARKRLSPWPCVVSDTKKMKSVSNKESVGYAPYQLDCINNGTDKFCPLSPPQSPVESQEFKK